MTNSCPWLLRDMDPNYQIVCVGRSINKADTSAVGSYRRIFVYTFCLINICLSLSDDTNKMKTLNIERK